MDWKDEILIVVGVAIVGFVGLTTFARAEGAYVKPWRERAAPVYRCPAETSTPDVATFVGRLRGGGQAYGYRLLRDAERRDPELAAQWRFSACWHFLDHPR